MRHCHFHFFRKIRFSLCLSLFLIGLGIFCAAVCKCADSDTWIVQFLTNPQADSGKSSSDADAPDAASASDASSENTTALNAAFTDYVTELFRQEASANLLNLHYTLADPAAYGITDYQTSLGTCSADSPALAAAFAENLLAGLQQFQSAELSAENRLTLDILSESLDLTKNGANWYCYEEPLTPTTGLQSQIPILLAEYTFRNTRDITDYLSLLSDIPRYFSEISAYEKEKAAAGRFMPSFAAQRLIQQCKDFTADLNSHYLVATFNEKTDAMSELSKNERAAYQNQNRDILEQQVFPAFEQLSNTIAELQNSGYNDAGLCHFPEGNTYYEYLVRCYTGSDDSVATLEKRTASQRKKDLLLVSELLEHNPDLTTESEHCDVAPQSPERNADYAAAGNHCRLSRSTGMQCDGQICGCCHGRLSLPGILSDLPTGSADREHHLHQSEKWYMKASDCSRHWRMKVFRDICIKTSTSTARICRPSGHCLAIPATQKAGRHSWNYIPIFTRTVQRCCKTLRCKSGCNPESLRHCGYGDPL